MGQKLEYMGVGLGFVTCFLYVLQLVFLFCALGCLFEAEIVLFFILELEVRIRLCVWEFFVKSFIKVSLLLFVID